MKYVVWAIGRAYQTTNATYRLDVETENKKRTKSQKRNISLRMLPFRKPMAYII